MAEEDHAADGPLEPVTFRFDMRPELLEFDDAARTITFRMVPDPRRYERVDEEDRHGWFDRFDDLFFPDDVMSQFADQLGGTPMYYQRPEIESAIDYVESRKGAIDAKLEGQGDPPTFEDKSETFLATLEADATTFVILSLDLQGSTRLSQAVAPVAYKTAITVILDELALVVSLFHGHVLKYTGDGLIAYFTPPSYDVKNDLALDCALTMSHLLYAAIFPALSARDFPPLEVRIGIDTGDAYVVAMGNPTTKQHRDIIGSVVNIAAKIQAQAPAGGILVGETVDRALHVGWREQLREFNPSPTWAYRRTDGSPYRLLEVVGPGARAQIGGVPPVSKDLNVDSRPEEGSEP
jgi:adenylate cyclase